MARSMLRRLVLVVALLLSSSVVSFCSVDDKCAACQAVAAELEIGLASEKPRNHLDMRHRLDSRGQREGKVIDYRVSELRVVELLDGLCDKMQDYTLRKSDSGKQTWEKVIDWDNIKINKQKAKVHSKAMSTFCGRLLEETEDEFSERVKKGLVQSGGVSKVLCEDLSAHCINRSDSSNVDDGEL